MFSYNDLNNVAATFTTLSPLSVHVNDSPLGRVIDHEMLM